MTRRERAAQARPSGIGGGDRLDERAPGAGTLPAGRVGRAHGLDGSFYVLEPLSSMLALGGEVTLAGRKAVIVRRAGTEQRPIVRLEGVEERSAAEALRGLQLTVERQHAPVLGEDEWWAHELEGCTVKDGAETLGTVSRLVGLPSCEALEVLSADGHDALLVPLVKDAIRSISPQSRVIEVDIEFLGLDRQARAPDAPSPSARRGRRSSGGGA